MKARKIILCIALCAAFSPSTFARKAVKTTITNWNGTEVRTRSETTLSPPSIEISENMLYIFSNIPLNNLSITIKNNSGNIVFSENVSLLEGIDYPVTINQLPQGDYWIYLVQGDNYIIGIFNR